MSENNTTILKKTILVVDDVEMNRDVVNKIFGNTHIVLNAKNGVEALDLLHKNTVDIVLLDIQMPLMDGYEVIQAMKSEHRLAEIPIIVTTGAIDKSERKAFDLGADDYLTQPYDPYIMKKRVENLIDRYSLREMRHAVNEQKKVRNFFDLLGIAYWEWSKDTGYYYSEKFEEYAISEVKEQIEDEGLLPQFIHPDDIASMKKFMQHNVTDEIKKSAVIRIKMKDGSYKWTELFSSVEFGLNGEKEYIVTAMRDVDKEWLAALTVEQKNNELNHIIDSTSGGVATLRVGECLRVTSFNQGLANKLGYTDEEMQAKFGENAYDMVYMNDLELLKNTINQVITSKESATLAYRIQIKDKSYKWFRASLYYAGEIEEDSQIYEVMTDIAEVNADYEAALNQTNEMVIIADWKSRELLYVNQAAANISGGDVKALFGKKCSQIAQHTDNRCFYCFKDELTDQQLLVKEMAVGKKYFQTKGKRIRWNGRDAFIEYVSDITAKHKMTEQVVFERNLLSAATRVIFPMCIISNLTRNTYSIVEYEQFNTKKAATDGIFDELIEVGASTIPEEDRQEFIDNFSRKNLLKAYAEGKKIISLIHRQCGDDGKIHWNRTIVVFADELFNHELFTITFTDNVDDQKKNEVELQEALFEAERANAAKTAFLSRVSHDMRTPLNGILGLTAILKDNTDDERISSDLNELELSGKYLLDLVNDTLDVGRIESDKLELHPSVCDGRNLFNSALGLLQTNAKMKDIQLQISAENIPFTILYVDIGRIQQIFMNVVGNAIKFTEPNGKIDITMSNISIENDVITDKIVIQDYGIGMRKEFIPHIFEAFSQEDNSRTSTTQGTGLGMAITKKLLELMNGDITVESEVGKGTCITIILPLQIASEEQIQNWKKKRLSKDDDQVDLTDRRILLCEDHPLNTKIATKLLEAKGMRVEHAENGEIAVQMFQDASPQYYDAILMDIRMPIMDGLDATKAIRKLPREDAKRIPIIAMTANALENDKKQTKEVGMNAHLSKPIQPDILYSTLRKFLYVDGNLQKKKILIVDDIAVNRAVLGSSLEEDYEILEAENGHQALEILQNNKGISVVITDIQMPEMDGVELIQKIRSHNEYRYVVIIANTQFGDPQQEEQLLALGANDFVYKPTTPRIVEIRVRNAIKGLSQ